MPAIGDKIAVQISFHPTEGVGWTTHVPQDIELAELNTMLDRLREATARQAMWQRIERMEEKLEAESERLAQLLSSVHMIDEKYPERELAPIEVRTTREQNLNSIIRETDLIDQIKANIARLRGQLNGG